MATSVAETAKDAASTAKAASWPSVAATIPPSAAPTASIVPHRDPKSAFAGPRSSASTRFGNAALDAGSNMALNDEIDASNTYAIHIVDPSRTSRNPRQSTARTRSHRTISFLRFRRSTRLPPTGDMRKKGISCETMSSAMETADPVSSITRWNSATSRNQSPPREMNDAR